MMRFPQNRGDSYWIIAADATGNSGGEQMLRNANSDDVVLENDKSARRNDYTSHQNNLQRQPPASTNATAV